jgi:TonB family protein
MKHPSGYAPRRNPAPRKNARLNLQRKPRPDPEKDLDDRQKSSFWKWVIFVALFHVLVLSIFVWVYELTPAPKPPEQFISLLPQGDVVKGSAGAQAAKKVGPTSTASVAHHEAAPSPTHPAQPPKPIPPVKPIVPPKPILKTEALTPETVSTVTPLQPTPPKAITPPKPTPPKVVPPKPPKIKVDLTKLEDGPQVDTPKPIKQKHVKKPVVKPDDTDNLDNEPALKADSQGLSKEQIAAKLGAKLEAEGVKNSNKNGISGSPDSHSNSFADFYASIRDQVMSQWQSPNLSDESAVNPVVQIHVEKDGTVPPDSVHLIQSSGNPTYDDSALSAAKSLGQLHEHLPEGCPPDIPITFKLTR